MYLTLCVASFIYVWFNLSEFSMPARHLNIDDTVPALPSMEAQTMRFVVKRTATSPSRERRRSPPFAPGEGQSPPKKGNKCEVKGGFNGFLWLLMGFDRILWNLMGFDGILIVHNV